MKYDHVFVLIAFLLKHKTLFISQYLLGEFCIIKYLMSDKFSKFCSLTGLASCTKTINTLCGNQCYWAYWEIQFADDFFFYSTPKSMQFGKYKILPLYSSSKSVVVDSSLYYIATFNIKPTYLVYPINIKWR